MPAPAKASNTSSKVPFVELEIVRATTEIRGERGIVPAGATGTVLMVHAGGTAYEIEFDEPTHAILCARREELEPA